MHNVTSVELKRYCEAVQIPSGASAILAAGTGVDITQTLGGSYTIHVQGALYRINERDADALGIEPSDTARPAVTAPQASEGPVDEKLVWDTLKTCYDPEIPVNIVDLGLVYDINIDPLPSHNTLASFKITLPAPPSVLCPT